MGVLKRSTSGLSSVSFHEGWHMTNQDRMRGCLLGLAAGDAVGTSVEFKPRGTFTPVTDMLGDGPFHLQAGQWTDDTSMALCLAASLVEGRDFDPADQMQRYLRWYDHGYMSSTGACFDIGNTTRQALERFRSSGKPMSGSNHPSTVGNGSLMRLAPVAMFYAPSRKKAQTYAARSSRTTHAAPLCLEACALFADMLVLALAGAEKEAILFPGGRGWLKSAEMRAIAAGQYRDKDVGSIRGSCYVVDCLEAALWCFWHTDTFAQAILAAANLGDDADTTAAVCGQLAGAYYGASGIPACWLEKLSMRAEITTLADGLGERREE
jgi:ADP-ribosyl-[dinitrogen reductase] hydrolase